MSSISLEVGKYYKDREGTVHGPMVRFGRGEYSFLAPDSAGFVCRTWTATGRYWDDGDISNYDLLEEVPAPCPAKQAVDVMEAAHRAEEAGGRKDDDGKPPISLIPRSAVLAEAEVLAYGAKKYNAHNWRKGMRWSRPGDAALRHLLAWLDGEDVDQESGLPHLAHVRANAGFLLDYAQTGAGEDDRYKAAR